MQRREFTGGAGTALLLAGTAGILAASRPTRAAARLDSRIAGVQIGLITYSFRSMPDQSAAAIVRYCRDSGVAAIELMGDAAEVYAGIPARVATSQTTQTSFADYHRAVAEWRARASMRPFEQLRREFHAAGISIYAFKPSAFEAGNSDAEVDYGMRAARALGASHVTVELPTDIAQVQRLGIAARRYGLRVGYHQHTQATPTLWDAALAASAETAINLDLGHYVAAGDYDGIDFIRKHHDRIASMHLKDRKNRANGQANLPWGQGDTPIAAALRLMRDQRYVFPASIELEYPVPAGSDAVKEVAKCLEFCRQALTTGA